MKRLAAILLVPAMAGAQAVDMTLRVNELVAADVSMGFGLTLRGVQTLAERIAANGTFITNTSAHVRGPSAVAAWLAADTVLAGAKATTHVLRWNISADGRDGYTYGYFDVVRATGETIPGKYHAYWRRDSDGKWSILAFQRGRRGPGAFQQIPRPAASLPVAATATVDTAALLREVFAAEAAFSDSAAVDVAGAFAAFAEPGAGKLAMPIRDYVFGRDAIRALFAGTPRGAGPNWKPETGSVAASGDLAFTYGPAWPRTEGPTPGTQTRGRYFTIWRKQADGTWRYVVD